MPTQPAVGPQYPAHLKPGADRSSIERLVAEQKIEGFFAISNERASKLRA
jgi:hypothetical protein